MLILGIIILIISSPKKVYANDDEGFTDIILKYVDEIDLSELDGEFEELSSFFEGQSLDTVIKSYVRGELGLGYENILSYALESFKRSASEKIADIVSVLFVAVFSAVVGALRPEMSDGVNKLCDFLFSAIVVGILASIFLSGYSRVCSAIFSISQIIQTAYPIILTLFAANGAGGSAATFSPAVGFLSGFYTGAIVNVLLPLCAITFSFYTVGNLSEKIKLNKFGDFFKCAFKWVIGAITLVFCFVLSMKSVVSSTFDGFSYKALKYAFSSGVPLVSQMVQGGFDVVFASFVLIKNAVGVVAAIMILSALLAPVIEIAVTAMILRLVAACVEPIGSNFASRSLSACADVFNLFNGLLICSGICFFLTAFLMITALGGAV